MTALRVVEAGLKAHNYDYFVLQNFDLADIFPLRQSLSMIKIILSMSYSLLGASDFIINLTVSAIFFDFM